MQANQHMCYPDEECDEKKEEKQFNAMAGPRNPANQRA